MHNLLEILKKYWVVALSGTALLAVLLVYFAGETLLGGWSNIYKVDENGNVLVSAQSLGASTMETNMFKVDENGNMLVALADGSFGAYKTVCAEGCDYTTDGTADDVQIREAIISASSTGGTVFVKRGTYDIANPINFGTKKNIAIECESHETIFTIKQASLANFSYSYIFSGGYNITINNCTFDGGYSTFTAPPGSQGGGVAITDRWNVSNNIFKNFNYFPIWNGVDSVDSEIHHNEFYGPGVGVDNIGGGGFENVKIYNNIWHSDIAGNVFDNVGGDGLSFHHNTSYSPNGVYLEGVTNSILDNNIFVNGTGFSVISDGGYSPAHIVNSRFTTITNNTISGGGSISFNTASSSTDPLLTIGGDITITNNTISSSTHGAIVVGGCNTANSKLGKGVIISNNKITNANTSGDASENTGCGINSPSGINIMIAYGVTVTGNVIEDDRTIPLQRYCIEIGQSYDPSEVNEPEDVTVIGNSCSGYAVGVINLVSPTYTNNFTNIWSSIDSTIYNNLSLATGGGDTTNALNIGGGGLLLGQYNGSATIRSGYSGKAFQINRTDNVTNTSFDYDGTGDSFIGLLGGKLGIGDSTPDYALDIEAGDVFIKPDNSWGGGEEAILYLGAPENYIKAGYSQGVAIKSYGGATDPIKFTTSIELMRMNDVGGVPNVGIGTTTPTYPLQVTTPTANATTTIEIGKDGQNKGSCLKMYNQAGTATYCYIAGTTFSCSTTPCN